MNRKAWLWVAMAAAWGIGATACGSNSPDTPAAPAPVSGEAALIKVLSNRADLISGDDALVELVFPQGVEASAATVTLNGTPVTAMFARRANGRVMGLVTGLALGHNTLTVTTAGGKVTHSTLINFPNGGPVFSGPQIQP